MKISAVVGLSGRGLYNNYIRLLQADEVIPAVDNYLDEGKRKENHLTANEAVGATDGDWIVFVGERQVMRPDWREELEKNIPQDFSGVVRIANVDENESIAAGMITRDFLEKVKYLFHPDYIHYWADVELAWLANEQAEVKNLELVEKTIENSRKQDKALFDWDYETFKLRKEAGFPRHLFGRNSHA